MRVSINELCAKSVHIFAWPFKYESDGTSKGFESFGKKIEHAGFEPLSSEPEISMPDRKDDIIKFRADYLLRQSLSLEGKSIYYSKNPVCKIYRYSRLFMKADEKNIPALYYIKTPSQNEYYLPITDIELYSYSFGIGIIFLQVIFPDEKEFDLHSDEVGLIELSDSVTKFTSSMKDTEALKIISDIEEYGAVLKAAEIPSDLSTFKCPLAIGIIDALSGEKYITSFEDDIENINSLSKDFDGHAFNMKNMRDVAFDLNHEASFFKDVILFGKLNSKEWESKLFEKKNHIKDEKIVSLSENRLFNMSLSFSGKKNADTNDTLDNHTIKCTLTDRNIFNVAGFLSVEQDLFAIALSEYYGIKSLSLSALEISNASENELLSDVEKDDMSHDLRRNFSKFKDKGFIKMPASDEKGNSFFEGLYSYLGVKKEFSDFVTRFGDLTVKHSKSNDSLFQDLFIVFASLAIIFLIAGGTIGTGAKAFWIVVVIILSFFIKEITSLLSRLKKFLREHVHIDFKK